jgi:hypothetical protein
MTRRTWLAFGDIEGRLAMLRVESTRVPARRALQRRQADHGGLDMAHETGLPAAQLACDARAVRPARNESAPCLEDELGNCRR